MKPVEPIVARRVNLSLNEVEATAKKAARGAGYPWGLCEEAAKATRWLCTQNIDGCFVLARRLEQFDGTTAAQWTPRINPDKWMAEGGNLCPIISGSSVSDYACALEQSGVRLHQVAQPALLFFFAAMTARQRRTTVGLRWPGVVAVSDGERISVAGDTVSDLDSVTLEFGVSMDRLNELCFRAEPSQITWNTLNRFAHRTYAPATEESRRMGAGAVLSNHD